MHLPGRNEAADRLAAQVGKLTERHERELRHLLGSPPEPARVPASFWEEIKREMEQELAAALLLMFLASAEFHGGDVDALDAVGKVYAADRAAAQAASYQGAVKSRLETLAEKSAASPTTGNTAGGTPAPSAPSAPPAPPSAPPALPDTKILEPLKQTFDAQAERIAASEITRAETAGGDAAQINLYGELNPEDTWRAHPSRTKTGSCGRCLRLDGVKRKDWGRIDTDAAGGPTLHEHCACTIEYAEPRKAAPTKTAA